MSNNLIGNLVLECEEEILNATENSLEDRNVVLARNNCFISLFY